jgi:hypothetical protein
MYDEQADNMGKKDEQDPHGGTIDIPSAGISRNPRQYEDDSHDPENAKHAE